MGNQPLPNNGFGLRVISVSSGSPACAQGVEQFADFIVGVTDVVIPNFKEEFSRYLSRNIGKEVILAVYNIIKQDYKEVRIIPSKSWPNADSLLGVRVKWESFITAQENIYRVSKVWPNSPGAKAGLREGEDFILGSPQFDYETFERFLFNVNYNFTQMEKPRIELSIYNVSQEKIRAVTIIPSREWGGDGLLGTELGTGYLNDLKTIQKEKGPVSIIKTVQALDEAPDGPSSHSPSRELAEERKETRGTSQTFESFEEKDTEEVVEDSGSQKNEEKEKKSEAKLEQSQNEAEGTQASERNEGSLDGAPEEDSKRKEEELRKRNENQERSEVPKEPLSNQRKGSSSIEPIEVFSKKLNTNIVINPETDLINMSVPVLSLVHRR